MSSKNPKRTSLSFTERLAKAKAAPRPTQDVEIILDAGIGDRIDAIRDELMLTQQEEAADLRLGQGFPKSDALQAKLDEAVSEAAGMVVTLRFTQMPAAEWAEVVARCPLRIDVEIDNKYGFDTDKIAALAAPLSGQRVEDGDLFKLADDEWRDLFDTISGNEIRRIADAIFYLNEFLPGKRLADAKKALAGRRG